MKVCLVIGREAAREWHRLLAARLLRDGHDVSLFVSANGPPAPSGLAATLFFERVVYGISDASLMSAKRVLDGELGQLPRVTENRCYFDVVIRLDGGAGSQPLCARTVSPSFNGAMSETGSVIALLDDVQAQIGVRDTRDPETPDYAIETEQPTILFKTLNSICARMIDLLAWQAAGAPLPLIGAMPQSSVVGVGSTAASRFELLSHGADTLSQRLRRRLDTLARGGDRWAVAWRDVAGTPFDPAAGSKRLHYRRILDDGRRFYADPFPVSFQGRNVIVCEEYPYASAKGIISVIDLADPSAAARPIIEAPCHLSYPMIFQDGGRWWMIPEAGASGVISLYRCDEFPYKWTFEAALLEGVAAADPTLYRDDSGYWLFFTSCTGAGSPSDRLCLYRASQLIGPWLPSGSQPLSIDAKASRPAGHIIQSGGATYRPVQDCSRRYGGAISWLGFNLKASGQFEQAELGRMRPANLRAFTGAHTFNRSGGIEAVDVFGAPDGPIAEITYERSRPAHRSSDPDCARLEKREAAHVRI